jgi:hypothetical protein
MAITPETAKKLRITFDPSPSDRIILILTAVADLQPFVSGDTVLFDDISELLPVSPRKVVISYAAVSNLPLVARRIMARPGANFAEVMDIVAAAQAEERSKSSLQ